MLDLLDITDLAPPFGLTVRDGGGADGVVGRYTSEAELDVDLNRLNLTAYTSLDGDDVRDAGAIQQIIVTAEGRTDFYAGGPFTFTNDANGDVARAVFSRWARVLAVEEAVAKRVPSTTDAGQALERRVATAIKEMQAFKADPADLPGAIAANQVVPSSSSLAGLMALKPAGGGLCNPIRRPCSC